MKFTNGPKEWLSFHYRRPWDKKDAQQVTRVSLALLVTNRSEKNQHHHLAEMARLTKLRERLLGN